MDRMYRMGVWIVALAVLGKYPISVKFRAHESASAIAYGRLAS